MNRKLMIFLSKCGTLIVWAHTELVVDGRENLRHVAGHNDTKNFGMKGLTSVIKQQGAQRDL